MKTPFPKALRHPRLATPEFASRLICRAAHIEELSEREALEILAAHAWLRGSSTQDESSQLATLVRRLMEAHEERITSLALECSLIESWLPRARAYVDRSYAEDDLCGESSPQELTDDPSPEHGLFEMLDLLRLAHRAFQGRQDIGLRVRRLGEVVKQAEELVLQETWLFYPLVEELEDRLAQSASQDSGRAEHLHFYQQIVDDYRRVAIPDVSSLRSELNSLARRLTGIKLVIV